MYMIYFYSLCVDDIILFLLYILFRIIYFFVFVLFIPVAVLPSKMPILFFIYFGKNIRKYRKNDEYSPYSE